MDEVDTKKQIDQMIAFIVNEAKDKAAEIEAKAHEDFNMEKMKTTEIVQQKIQSDIQKTLKDAEKQVISQRSKLLSKLRLEKINMKYNLLLRIKNSVKQGLANLYTDTINYSKLCIDLIIEGMFSLFKQKVYIQVRKEDYNMILKALPDAVKKFEKLLISFKIKNVQPVILIDQTTFLPSFSENPTESSCLGGVIILSEDMKLSCDNTLDKRLEMSFCKIMSILNETLYLN